MGRACATCQEEEEPEGVKPLGRHRHGWSIKLKCVQQN
jgi:hypothetical protein